MLNFRYRELLKQSIEEIIKIVYHRPSYMQMCYHISFDDIDICTYCTYVLIFLQMHGYIYYSYVVCLKVKF